MDDAIAAFLDGPRASGAFLLRSIMSPPWSLRIEDGAPLTIVALVSGRAWICPDDAEPQSLAPGDIAIIRGPDHYTVSDDPASPPQVVIHPGQHCTTPDGVSLTEAMSLGIRSWGNSSSGSTTMLTGTYTTDGEISHRLLDVLPVVIVLRRESWDSPLVELLAGEVVKDEPGEEVVLDRLLDLLLVATLRAWFSRVDANTPQWFQAHSDPVVGLAMRLLHNNPAHQWTVANLATDVGVSRATLARRFNELVGEPPMTFLTRWRLALAADLLRAPHASVNAVARTVGYSSPFTFSTAFKRHHGVSPKQYRDARADVRDAGTRPSGAGEGASASGAPPRRRST